MLLFNIKGECCHRGSALGVLMGLVHGMNGIPKRWIDGLVAKDEITKEIEDVITVMPLVNHRADL